MIVIDQIKHKNFDNIILNSSILFFNVILKESAYSSGDVNNYLHCQHWRDAWPMHGILFCNSRWDFLFSLKCFPKHCWTSKMISLIWLLKRIVSVFLVSEMFFKLSISIFWCVSKSASAEYIQWILFTQRTLFFFPPTLMTFIWYHWTFNRCKAPFPVTVEIKHYSTESAKRLLSCLVAYNLWKV